ncbi:hypothetical protein CRN59_06860 [Vibrio vulnificus]|nr:hypothetical protein CRN59_06860 [Vibrio vulnificus]POC69862.1 hypothetical protein CRN56_02295 [Vibrio vulnificus Env1]
MARLYVLVSHRANKAFKNDSQRLAVSLRSSIAKRRSHLNAALCHKFRIQDVNTRDCLFNLVRYSPVTTRSLSVS